MTARVLAGFPGPPIDGVRGDPGLFGPGSSAWRVNGEMALLFGGGRALLMQVAHPLVAAGVADHSGFATDPFARLWRTLEAMLEISFGDRARARRAATRVNAVHGRVRGRAPDGSPYDALQPELLAWVHATLVDSALVVYERFVAPLRPAGRDRYVDEMRSLGAALHVPDELMPSDAQAFRRRMAATIATLEVGEQARAIGSQVLNPAVPTYLRPATALFRAVTVELLPSALRAGYGLRPTAVTRRATASVAALSRTLVPVLPSGIRRWPHAREASRRTGSVNVPREG